MWSPTWVGDRLRADGLITVAHYNAALNAMGVHDERIEEALLRVGALEENRLLRYIAEKTRTQYLSTTRLARVDVSSEALAKIPARLAEKMLVFPVHFDARTNELIVASPDSGSPEFVKQITIATRVRSLKPCIARPAAVKASIAKWYRGEIQAFAGLDPEVYAQIEGLDLGDADGEARGARRDQRGAAEIEMSARAHLHSQHELGPPPAITAPTNPAAGAPVSPAIPRDAGGIGVGGVVPLTGEAAAREPRGGVDRRTADLAEMLHVLVALGENARDEFRGHSAHVARLSRQLAKQMGLDETTATYVAMAANLHDLGKPVAYHLTALNVAQYQTHRNAAQKLANTPLRLLESIELPSIATAAVASMYERFDGKGFPAGTSRKEIPTGARVIAICDTYSDLTLNPRNPYRRSLSHNEAMEVIQQYRATLFDPDIVDLLGVVVAGEDIRRKLGDEKPVVLLVEPEPEEATILELRLVAQGFQVQLARSATQAIEIARSVSLNFVLSEVELTPFDGFELLSRVREADGGKELPFIFVARASDTETIERAFAKGAQDYVVKPTSGDVLAAKLRRLGQPRSRSIAGIAGSLSEMGLPDLAQILEQGRKTGRLKLKLTRGEGEVHFSQGRIVHAVLGQLVGKDAFYEMLTMPEGSFALDPTFVPSATTIQSSAESLILEGLRRLDERNRSG